MKKVGIIIAGLVLAGSLAACGSSSSDGYSSPDTYSPAPAVDPPAVDTSTPEPDTSGQITQGMADQLGQEICADLRGGMTQAQAWSIFQTVGLTASQGAAIMAAAIQDYCPDQAP